MKTIALNIENPSKSVSLDDKSISGFFWGLPIANWKVLIVDGDGYVHDVEIDRAGGDAMIVAKLVLDMKDHISALSELSV